MKLSNLLNIANSEWPHWRHFLEIEAKFKQVFKKKQNQWLCEKAHRKNARWKNAPDKKAHDNYL